MHLSSAFVILATGYFISLAALVAEKIARNLVIFRQTHVVV